MRRIFYSRNGASGGSELFEILTDGSTVWVSTPEVTIGRFSRRGVDVHCGAEAQLSGGAVCLDCRVDPDWEGFVSSMLEHHGVVIDEGLRPSWCMEGA